MPNAVFYTVLDEQGNIVRSQITQDPNFEVGVQQRLVKDQTPEYNSLTQTIVRIEPIPAGQDHVEYQVRDIVYTEQQLINMALNKRNARLQKSDWTQLADVPLTTAEKNDWAVYRQSLRNITEQPGYPNTIDWPTAPPNDWE
jgi:hypothetical protein